MSDRSDDDPTTSTSKTPERGTDSTVTDWHGQEVERDVKAAERALSMADGDEVAAEEIFDDIRPDHPSDRINVPAEEREGTLVSPPDVESDV